MGVIAATHFNLPATVESGQIFRYQRRNGGYVIAHGDRHFWVQQRGEKLHFTGTSRKFLNAFFRLDEDHAAVLQRLGRDPLLRAAIAAHAGLRLIRQDPRECAVAFLCSQMSNVKRIMGNMHALAHAFGQQRENVLGKYYAFPAPHELGGNKLQRMRLGFRTTYIAGAGKALTDAFFAELRELPYTRAKEQLCALPGIGEKVADCILLYSLEKMEAFPVDVWVKRAMEELCFGGKRTSEKRIREFAAERWGNDAGYAQQYLFHWRRMLRKIKQSPTESSALLIPGRRRGTGGGVREAPQEEVAGGRSKFYSEVEHSA